MVSVIIVDDHPVVLNGTKNLLEAFEFNVLGTALNDTEFWDIIKTKNQLPTVVLLDIKLNTVEGIGFAMASKIKEKYPQIKILAFSSESNVYNIKQMYMNGAIGFIDKAANGSYLRDAILKSAKGEPYFLLCVKEDRVAKFKQLKKDELLNICVPLNHSEKIFLQLLSTHLSYAEIAQKMSKSINEIEHIRKIISTKLNVHTRQEMVLFSAQNGFT